LEQIDSQRTFRDVCAKSGKWFRAQENCFVVPPATKQSGAKYEQFQRMAFQTSPRAAHEETRIIALR
jgi:hypothetical protein